MPSHLCTKCHLEISDDTLVLYKKKPYHSHCLEIIKEKARAKDAIVAKRVSPALALLHQYICQLYNISVLTPYLHKQIANYYQDYHISYEDMLLALRYFFEICGGEIREAESPTIGIVPYMLEEAKRFDATLKTAEAANATFKPVAQQAFLSVRKPSSAMALGYSIEDL